MTMSLLVHFRNRLVLSAMAGINDHRFCSKFPVALAILGGFSADDKSMRAGMKVVKRGRREFIFSNPLEGIRGEVVSLLSAFSGQFAINVRSFSDEGYIKAARLAAMYGGIVEINAHCRQPEFKEIGCGEELLKDTDRLSSIVERTSKVCITAVKIRGNVEGVRYRELISALKDAGCHIIHVDAMIPGGDADFELVRKVSSRIFTIGNNSVDGKAKARKMLDSGASLVSAARAVLRDEDFFHALLTDERLSGEVWLRVNV